MAFPFAAIPAALSAASTIYGMTQGPRRGPGLSKMEMFGNWTRRHNQIGEFASRLASSRMAYQAALNNLYSNTLQNYAPQAEAVFAGRGLSPVGGAYQSALAKETAKLQSSLNTELFNREREDIMAVDDAYARNEAALMGSPWAGTLPDTEGQAFGQLGSNLGLIAYDMFKNSSGTPGAGSGNKSPNFSSLLNMFYNQQAKNPAMKNSLYSPISQNYTRPPWGY